MLGVPVVKQWTAGFRDWLDFELKTPLSTVLDGGFPRLHFSRKNVVETALRNFSPPRLVAVIDQLATAALDMRKQTSLAAAIAQRTLLAIAANAKRKG